MRVHLTVLLVQTIADFPVVPAAPSVQPVVLRNVISRVRITVRTHVLQTVSHHVQKLVVDVVHSATHALVCVLVYVLLNVKMDVLIVRICVAGGAMHHVVAIV